MEEKYDIRGKVVSVSNSRKHSHFVIQTKNTDKRFTIESPFFCPVHEGDVVSACCRKDGLVYTLLQPPVVLLGQDKDTLIQCFMRALKGKNFGAKKAEKLYEELSNFAGDKSVDEYLTDAAKDYTENKLMYIIDVGKQAKIPEFMMERLLSWWIKNRDMRCLYLLGLYDKEIKACYLPLKEIYKLCVTNPYKLLGVSLEKCDTILLRINRKLTDEDRLCGSIIRKIQEYLTQCQWVGTPMSNLYKLFPDFMKMEEKLSDFGVTFYEGLAYNKFPLVVEESITARIMNTLECKYLKGYQAEEPKYDCRTLSDNQKEAIAGALNSKVCIITGGAGTGKTTIIREIIGNLEIQDIEYITTSFTGKAVSRIREVVGGRAPLTLHAMIAKYLLFKDTPIQYLIVDEVSMVTTHLLFDLFRFYTYDFRIILVGDRNQLQPIGWGALMDGLMESGKVPIFRLEKNFRLMFQQGDGILTNATNIIDHVRSQPFDFIETSNFSLQPYGQERINDIVVSLKNAGVPITDVTVITPYNRDIGPINDDIQQIYNPDSESITDVRGVVWKIGDRVMMTTNHYKINIMNGEEGLVVNFTKEKELVVQFKGENKHKFKTQYELTKEDETDVIVTENYGSPTEITTRLICRSSCLTGHKSQGSEWPFVLVYIPFNPANWHFLDWKYLYTIITRSKMAAWIIGDIEAAKRAVCREPPVRYDRLAYRMSTYQGK